MPSFRYIRYVLFSVVLIGNPAHALQDAGPLHVATLDDGQQRRGRLHRDATGKFVFQMGDSSIPLRRLVRVEFPATAPVRETAAPFRAYFRGGERLAVQAVRFDDHSGHLVLADQTKLPLERTALSAVSTGDGLVPLGRLRTDHDRIILADGDELFGELVELDENGCTLRGAFPSARFAWPEVRRVQLRRAQVRGRPVRGLFVRLNLRNSGRPEDDDVLQGAVIAMDAEGWRLDHPHLGRVRLPRSRIRAAEILGEGLRVDVESAGQHLGNDIRPKWRFPLPDGTELVRSFSLETVPAGPATLVCEVQQLESAQFGKFAGDLKEGHLQTNLWINDRLVDLMNRHVVGPIDQPQWLRIALPANVLKQGANTLRISQTPLSYDPNDFDDFLIANLAIEFSESSE